MVGEKKMTCVTWKEDQVRKVGLSPLISLLRNTWKKLKKTYYGGEGLICFLSNVVPISACWRGAT